MCMCSAKLQGKVSLNGVEMSTMSRELKRTKYFRMTSAFGIRSEHVIGAFTRYGVRGKADGDAAGSVTFVYGQVLEWLIPAWQYHASPTLYLARVWLYHP